MTQGRITHITVFINICLYGPGMRLGNNTTHLACVEIVHGQTLYHRVLDREEIHYKQPTNNIIQIMIFQHAVHNYHLHEFFDTYILMIAHPIIIV